MFPYSKYLVKFLNYYTNPSDFSSQTVLKSINICTYSHRQTLHLMRYRMARGHDQLIPSCRPNIKWNYVILHYTFSNQIYLEVFKKFCIRFALLYGNRHFTVPDPVKLVKSSYNIKHNNSIKLNVM